MSKHNKRDHEPKTLPQFMPIRELQDYLATRQSEGWPRSKSIHPERQARAKMRKNLHISVEVESHVRAESILRAHNL